MPAKLVVKPGTVFGRLTVIKEVEPVIYYCQRHGKKVSVKHRKFRCKCTCGKKIKVRLSSLKSKNTQSCGCLQKEIASEIFTTHGDSQQGSPYHTLYTVYDNMLQRCTNPKRKHYQRYGGRGIAVYKKWLGFNGYANFKRWALAHGWGKELTLERRDNNGHYRPSNCYFANRKTQSNNQECTTFIAWTEVCQNFGTENNLTLEKHRNYTKDGKVPFSYVFNEFALPGLKYNTAYMRYTKSGWTLKDSLSTPPLDKSK